MKRVRFGVLLVGIAAIAIPAAPAGGATTVGSDLEPPPVNSLCTAGNACLVMNTALPGAALTSPIKGVIVRWRIRYGNADVAGNGVRLAVMRPAGGGAFTAVSRSATRTVSPPGNTLTFDTGQPVEAGDQVALDLDQPNGNLTAATASQAGVVQVRWLPPLATGSTLAPTSAFGPPSLEVAINADVEADRDCDGLGDESQDPSLGASCGPASPVAKRKCKKRKAKQRVAEPARKKSKKRCKKKKKRKKR